MCSNVHLSVLLTACPFKGPGEAGVYLSKRRGMLWTGKQAIPELARRDRQCVRMTRTVTTRNQHRLIPDNFYSPICFNQMPSLGHIIASKFKIAP